MELLVMFIIMIAALLWVFGVPIALIVIAFNLLDIRRAIETEVAKPAWDYKEQTAEADFRKEMLGKAGPIKLPI